MAKNGSNRGGARAGAGRPRKALADKIADGNSGRPITVLSPVAELEANTVQICSKLIKNGIRNSNLKK